MSLEVVKRARAKYDALSGPERAYAIVNQVAWDLRADGAGTFYKPAGQNYKERSLDVIIYKPGGETYDCLQDAEGKAIPAWGRTKPTGYGDVSKWRAAVPPVTVDPTPEPEPEPPPSADYVTRAEFDAYKHQVDQRFKALRDELLMMILDLTSRVDALEASSGTAPAATAYMLVSDPNAAPISTSRDALHDHELRAAVVPKAKG